MTLFRAVTAHGTGAAVAQMNHPLGGKTGTTSDYTDAWFLGFSPSVTCGVWVGYDSRQSLGEKETGARAALPIWMEIHEGRHRRQGRRAVPRRCRTASDASGQILASRKSCSRADFCAASFADVSTADPLPHAAAENHCTRCCEASSYRIDAAGFSSLIC